MCELRWLFPAEEQLFDWSYDCTSFKNLPAKELGHMISTMRSIDETVIFIVELQYKADKTVPPVF